MATSTVFDKIGTDRLLQDHWLRRLIAAVIDFAIISIITWIISLIFPSLGVTWPIPFFARPSDFLNGVILFLYAAFLESTWGTTIGKQIMYLKVTTKEGKLPTLDRTLIRDLSKILGVLWLIDTLIGMFTVGDPYQKYSDRFAGTTVASTLSTPFILRTPPSRPATTQQST